MPLELTSWDNFCTLGRQRWDLCNHQTTGLVDTRSVNPTEEEQSIIRAVWVVVVHIPLTELRKRRFELPTRNCSFAIVVSTPEDLELVNEILCSGSSPWSATIWGLIRKTNDRSPILYEELLTAPLRLVPKDPTTTTMIPYPRLWKPDPMVETILLPLLKSIVARHIQLLQNDRRPLRVVDVGSGVGRDLCFLSEELYGFGRDALHFIGVDQRYRDGNDETLAFWHRRGQSRERCRCLCVDLKKVHDFMDQIITTTDSSSDTLGCVYSVRYWNEALFERLASDLTQPGTIVAVSQFGKPNDAYVWDHSTPKERNLVSRSRLLEIFGAGWRVVHNEIAFEPDKGRPLVQFVVQRPLVD